MPGVRIHRLPIKILFLVLGLGLRGFQLQLLIKGMYLLRQLLHHLKRVLQMIHAWTIPKKTISNRQPNPVLDTHDLPSSDTVPMELQVSNYMGGGDYGEHKEKGKKD